MKVLARFAAAFLLAAGLLALAAIVAFGSLGRHSPWGWVLAILGLIALALWFVGSLGNSQNRDKHAGQRAMMGVNSIASVLLLLVILVGVNYVSARHHRIFDLTKNHINSLAPQSHKILGKLKNPLTLTYVYVPTQTSPGPSSKDKQLLDAYANASANVKVKFVNVLNNPMEAQKLKLTNFSGQPELLIVPQKGATAKRQQVSAIDEGNITSAMMKIVNPKPKVLYFLGGHGEMSPGNPSGKITQAVAALKQQNYTVKPLILAGAGRTIPKDASAVVALGPTKDLSAPEEKILQHYASGKGHLVLMFDPPQTSTTSWHNWRKLLQSLGVTLGDGIVLDFQQAYSSPQFVVGKVGDAVTNPVLRSVGANNLVVFPGVVPLHDILPTPPALSVTPLFQTSQQSQSVAPDGGQKAKTQKGPFVLAAAIERTKSGKLAANPKTKVTEGMRAVVAANASFITDNVFSRFANRAFFLGAVNWTVGNEALVSIPPRKPVKNSIDITAPTRRFLVLFALLVLPALALVLGGTVWWQRRG